MFEQPRIRWRRRIFRAIVLLVLNAFFWIFVPLLLVQSITGLLPSVPLVANQSYIYAFGAIITGLQVMGALTEGGGLSVAFLTGSSLAVAYYIWTAGNGGSLGVAVAGISATFAFPTLLFLFMLPPMFNAIRLPLTYFLEESEGTAPSSESV